MDTDLLRNSSTVWEPTDFPTIIPTANPTSNGSSDSSDGESTTIVLLCMLRT